MEQGKAGLHSGSRGSSIAARLGLASAAAIRRFEARLSENGLSMAELMARAADAAAAVSRASGPRRVAVLVGPGNNGGDGALVAARLARAGVAVQVIALSAREGMRGADAQAAAREFAGAWHVAQAETATGLLAELAPDLIIDAMFGIGLTRPLADAAAALCSAVAAMQAAAEPPIVLAVDIASGVDSDTGQVLGPAIFADATVTFFAAKPGHVLQPGRAHAGVVHVRDLGTTVGVDDLAEAWRGIAINRDIIGPECLSAIKPRAATAHKYHFGHVLVAAGGLEGGGAARLAARGALRAGAGLVTLAVPGAALMAHAGRGPDALMVRRADGAEDLAALLADPRRNTAVLGPALGAGAAGAVAQSRAKVLAALSSSAALVLDADALTAFTEAPSVLIDVLRARAAPVVLTPHEGEFARLFSAIPKGWAEAAGVADAHAALHSPSKIDRAAAAARITGQTIVLKGADTVVTGMDEGMLSAGVNVNGTPDLATAGSGDVLAGIIAGLLACGLRAGEAARAGVYLHAEAGRRVGAGLIADDLPEALAAVLKELFPVVSDRGPQ